MQMKDGEGEESRERNIEHGNMVNENKIPDKHGLGTK
jgi:hypothetical protein